MEKTKTKTSKIERKIYNVGNKICRKEKLTFLDNVKVIGLYFAVVVIRGCKAITRMLKNIVSKVNWEHAKYFCIGIGTILLTAFIAYFGISVVEAAKNLGPNVSDYNLLKIIAGWF